MNIAVNTRLLLKDKLEGIGWFSYETLKRITTQHKEHTFYFLFDRPFDDEFIFSDNIIPKIIPPQARHPFLYVAWFDLALPLAFRKIKPDLFLSPDGMLSTTSDVKSLPVIHDLNFEHFPNDLPTLTRLYYNRYFPKFAHKAKRIATVSEFSKRDIAQTYGVNEDKIDVVYNGSNEYYSPISYNQQQRTRQIYAQNCQYFLFIGSLHPRKNLANLFYAFESYKQSTGLDTKLMIVGQKKWWTDDIRKAYKSMEHKNAVIFTGRLSTVEVKNVLASALAMVYVSTFEGFGIPILEAMSCDIPVITSNVTSMPEVGGDAVLTVDPFSVESIKNAMVKIAKDSNLRNQLIVKGQERRQLFSWQLTADKIWTSIEKTIAE
jgi:glycosyltransferase involved in cell wall biosynthesis